MSSFLQYVLYTKWTHVLELAQSTEIALIYWINYAYSNICDQLTITF